ncbi:MAG: hypothetical protein R3Y13_01625 [bacterium]
MKKIQRFFRNNMIVILLTSIIFICLGLIGYVAITHFFGGSETVYGDRLDTTGDYDFSVEEIEELINEDEDIVSSSVKIHGKVLYVTIHNDEGISLSSAKKKAKASLSFFEEELLNYYDCNYIIHGDEFTLMGYKNSESSSIVWNNNTKFEVESE